MQVSKVSNDEAEILLEKELNLSNTNQLKKVLFELANGGVKKVRLDCSGLEHIDSSGLGKVLFFTDLFRQREGFLKLVNVKNPEIQDMFRLIRLEKVVNIE